MKVKLSESTEGDGLGIPYPADKSAGRANAGCFDLKRGPSRISDIHEIQGHAELEEFVRTVNHPDSFFRTVRCGDVLLAAINDSSNQTVVSSYVTIAFEILEFNIPKECYVELYKRFVQSALICTRCEKTFVEFRLIQTSYNDHKVNRAWSMDVEIRGLGQTPEEARTMWALGWSTVQKFLAKESSLFIGELNKGRKTIS